MCLVSIILKEIRGRWIRKYQVLLFFMLRQLKTTDSLINSDEVAWNLAISEANLCRGSQNSFYKTFLKNFVKFTEKDLCQSLFFKTFCNFKRGLAHFFSFEFWTFLKTHFFAKCLQVTASAPWKITQKVYKTYHQTGIDLFR